MRLWAPRIKMFVYSPVVALRCKLILEGIGQLIFQLGLVSVLLFGASLHTFPLCALALLHSRDNFGLGSVQVLLVANVMHAGDIARQATRKEAANLLFRLRFLWHVEYNVGVVTGVL